jgi:hypothetical protein
MVNVSIPQLSSQISNTLLFTIVVFILGLYFVVNYSASEEGFVANQSHRCPNILIQKGTEIYLYNSQVAKVPGVNPLRFNNLEDYVEFMKWQRSQGIVCPVLYLQQTNDAQGKNVYKIRPSPVDLQGGLPPMVDTTTAVTPGRTRLPPITKLMDSNRNDPPFNTNSYPGFDATGFNMGDVTPLDLMNYIQQDSGMSPNPMDPNWGGPKFTQHLIDSGYYEGDQVSLYIP